MFKLLKSRGTQTKIVGEIELSVDIRLHTSEVAVLLMLVRKREVFAEYVQAKYGDAIFSKDVGVTIKDAKDLLVELEEELEKFQKAEESAKSVLGLVRNR